MNTKSLAIIGLALVSGGPAQRRPEKQEGCAPGRCWKEWNRSRAERSREACRGLGTRYGLQRGITHVNSDEETLPAISPAEPMTWRYHVRPMDNKHPGRLARSRWSGGGIQDQGRSYVGESS